MLWNWYTIDACMSFELNLHIKATNQRPGFLAKSWRIRSQGMFAGSCIGTICLVLCLEFLRRLGREYDAFILRRARLRRMYLSGSIPTASGPVKSNDKNYQSINTVEENAPEITTCQCSVTDNDLIVPAPVSSEESSTQKQIRPIDTVADEQSKNKYVAARLAMLEPYRPSPLEQMVRALLHMCQFAVAYIIMLLAMYYNGYIIICIFLGAFLGSLIFSWEPVSLNKE